MTIPSRSLLYLSFLLPTTHGLAEGVVQFNKDIRPILSENCFHCHGPDPGSRKAQLRLDTKEGFFASSDKRGATVIAGQAAESPLYQRLINTDPDEHMPPPETHKELKPAEIALIKQWIDTGAQWQPHWSLMKPERPPVPTVANPSWVRNPIDAFVLQKLAAKGLTPAPEADRAALARRLSLDLTGLLPTPTEVDTYVADQAADADARYLAAMMAKPQWGEHRGRYWLDAARYADTHGLHFDNYREMWPYRDWVINAFNHNQPFDQFTIEQVAGDLLPKPTTEQLVATGFHRCNATTNEGGTIAEENLVGYARERAETTSWVWLGLTANCAVCHDHKFDPITQKDFYALSAFFRNTTQGAMDGNAKDTQPSMRLPMLTDRARYDNLGVEIAVAQKAREGAKAAAEPNFQRWLTTAQPEEIKRDLPTKDLVLHAPLNEGRGLEAADRSGALPRKLKATKPVTWEPGGKLGAAPVLGRGVDFAISEVADYEKDEPFSYGAWVFIPKGYRSDGSVLAKMDRADGFKGYDLFVQKGTQFVVHVVHHWPDNALKVTTKAKTAKPGTWQHVFVTYDGSAQAEGIKLYLDGKLSPTTVDHNSLQDSIRTTAPFRIGQRTLGEGIDGGSAQDVRVYQRVLTAAEISALAQSSHLAALLALAAKDRMPEQTAALLDYYLNAKEPDWQTAQKQLAALETERTQIDARSPVTHVQLEKMNSKAMAAVLFRGSYDQPRDKVEADTFAALHPFPKDAPRNRLGLAQWLVSPENPLTSRVVVNRFWQEIFGTGLVKTSEDLGIMGDAPSHPELLDWLAVEFRESGWDVKKLFALMVTSNTYRQAAVTTPAKLEADPANRLLSRGPRFRMDAEMVRDAALKGSNLLVAKLGGPSVKPYQPEGIWEAVAMPESNTRRYQQDTGEALYRRSLYTFWKRAAPPASMEIFNASAREVSCLRRERANTPLQALVTMNDVQFVEASRRLAEQALKASTGATDANQPFHFLGQHLLSRTWKPQELGILQRSLAAQLAAFQADPAAARKLINFGESKPDPALDPATLAAWSMLANQVLNLDEMLNK